MTHHVRSMDAESIHQTGTILREQPRCVVHVRLIASAQASMIVNQDLIMPGKLRHLRHAPRGKADAGTGHENKRITLPVNLVREIYVVDFDFGTSDRTEFFHYRLQSQRDNWQTGDGMWR